jgi:hypothetical protein
VGGKVFEEELYKWVLVPEPRAGVLKFFVTVGLRNNLLQRVEVNITFIRDDALTMAGSLQVQGGEPDAYIDFVLDMLVQLFSIFELSEEHYEQHIYL